MTQVRYVRRLCGPGLWVMLALPGLLVALALHAGMGGQVRPDAAVFWGGGAAVWGVVLWLGMIGKYLALVAATLGWISIGGFGFVALMGVWGLAVGAGFALLMLVLAFHAAVPWALARSDRLAGLGRATIEAEWIAVPREFARGHRLYRLGFGIYLTALAVLSAGFFGWHLSGGPLWPWAILALACVGFMALKAAVASPLVYLGLLPGLPFTLPFMFYWADGVRPNLIYRHRFGRLVLKEMRDV